MKTIKLLSVVAIVLAIAVGCGQTTTSTGPATTGDKSGNPAVKKLSMTAAPEQTIILGGTGDVAIKISRENFNDPVTIRLADLPQGIEASKTEVVIPAGEVAAMLNLKANPDAKVGTFKVEIDAQAPGLEDNVQTFTLWVKEKEKGSSLPDATPFDK
jgi:hypothetical protein